MQMENDMEDRRTGEAKSQEAGWISRLRIRSFSVPPFLLVRQAKSGRPC